MGIIQGGGGLPFARERALVLPRGDFVTLLQPVRNKPKLAFGPLERPVDVDDGERRDSRDCGQEGVDLGRRKLAHAFLERRR